MSRAPVRRSHLVSPFGTGSLLVAPDGTSMIAAGLDHWFAHDDGRELDDAEFRIEEWRLQRRLGVSHFRLPPDYRRRRPGQDVPNTGLTIPFLRFPRWHFCPGCKRLSRLRMETRGRQICNFCKDENRTRFLAQVPFVAMCDAGHLQDFPWSEWVHSSSAPSCNGELRLYSTGGTTLANQRVACTCGKSRNLGGITEASTDGMSSFLTTNLEPGQRYTCRGVTPQHGSDRSGSCDRPLRGSLRSATNLYFGLVRSAIYLPSTAAGTAPGELVSLLLGEPDLVDRIASYGDADRAISADTLRSGYRKKLKSYSDAELEAAAKAAYAVVDGAKDVAPDDGDDEETEEQFRRAEAHVLSEASDRGEELTVVQVHGSDYAGIAAAAFSQVNLVERLRETRVLAGFSRVFPDERPDPAKRASQLWLKPPQPSEAWLPGYTVFGEGLFFTFEAARVAAWEQKPEVIKRTTFLRERYDRARETRNLRERDLSARFLLVHTFAHVLMNQLSFECGYSSAALRERLYVSTEPGQEQAALLIYTAAGDAEGTMGGLVRMGRPGYLENVLEAALKGSSWCASDPVCMEIGSAHGQGPDSCNLAACHGCGLVPETACEEFNRFLDRGVLTGDSANPGFGYFPTCGWST
jgi:hypothetical protein